MDLDIHRAIGALQGAIGDRISAYQDAIALLRESGDTDEYHDAIDALEEAVVFVGALRRMLSNSSPNDVRLAFDGHCEFADDSLVSQELARVYRVQS